MEKILKRVPEIKVSYSFKVKAKDRVTIMSSQCAYRVLKEFYKDCMQHHEELWVIYLNRSNQVLGVSNLSKGGVAGTLFDARSIIQIALKANACALIISHNHPSGGLIPSTADRNMTSNIKEACALLQIPLHDSIIVTDEGYYSFLDEGLL